MNEQLTSDELRQVLAEWIRPMYPKERQKIAGLFEAVIARAEAAEADNRRLTARVAELEAALAAQGWRPVTEDWPPREKLVLISYPGATWVDIARRSHDGEETVWLLNGNRGVLDFDSATVAHPLPPAPQEPTP